jgi:hypothetical protein
MDFFFSFILKLDRHLHRLDNDLDKVHDETRNESRSPQSMVPTRQASPMNTLKLPLAEMIGEGSQRKRKLKLMLAIPLSIDHFFNNEFYLQSGRRANSHISSGRSTPSIRTRSRETTPSRGPRRQHAPPRHGNDSDSQGESDEPLYCICQQVSYGAMVACDGEVRSCFMVY